MSGIARILIARGAKVSGSDIHDSASLSGLRSLGIQTFVGHDAANIAGAEFLVRSSAVPESNVEIAAAIKLGIPVKEGAQALAELMIGARCEPAPPASPERQPTPADQQNLPFLNRFCRFPRSKHQPLPGHKPKYCSNVPVKHAKNWP